jgi:hypothetical protein
MAIVNDEVVEVWLQAVRRPALFHTPPAGSLCDVKAARAAPCAGDDQDVPVRRYSGLHDRGALPRVLPEHFAVGWSEAHCAGAAHEQDLLDSGDGHEMRRAVALAGRAGPARITGGEVIGKELTGRSDDDAIVGHYRRARETPVRNRRAVVGRHVSRPQDGAVIRIERVQDSGRAKCVYATVMEGRRRARTGAGIRLKESRAIAMRPHGLARTRVVAGDDLVVAALLLRVDAAAGDRERRPAWSDRPPPHFHWRRSRPVSLDPRVPDDSVTP